MDFYILKYYEDKILLRVYANERVDNDDDIRLLLSNI